MLMTNFVHKGETFLANKDRFLKSRILQIKKMAQYTRTHMMNRIEYMTNRIQTIVLKSFLHQ